VNTNSIIFRQTKSFHKTLNEMLGYKPGLKSGNFNIELNSFTAIGESFSLTDIINPGSKAA
jgi:hypothetical protein